MASDKLHRFINEFESEKDRPKKYQIDSDENYRNCTVPYIAACPVVINFCDASAKSRSFSEAVIDFSVDCGFPLAFFLEIGHSELISYLLGKTVNKSEAIKRLEDFISNENHKECLLSLHENHKYSEFDIQVILAAHLFGPLADDNSYKIGNEDFPRDGKARRCPKCNLDVSSAIQNTSLGNGDVWHGYADILVKRSSVKVAYKIDEGGGRTECIGDDEGSSADESYDSESIVGVKKDVTGSHAFSQGLSLTIVNAFCEVKNNQSLSKSFIPSFITTGQNVRICMYNCDIDRLVMTDNLDLFLLAEEGSLPILHLKTILSLWYVLNFDIAFDKMKLNSEAFLEFMQRYKKSNFEEQAGPQYSTYKENCTKPMTVKSSEKHKKYAISSDFIVSPASSGVKKMILNNREIITTLRDSLKDTFVSPPVTHVI